MDKRDAANREPLQRFEPQAELVWEGVWRQYLRHGADILTKAEKVLLFKDKAYVAPPYFSELVWGLALNGFQDKPRVLFTESGQPLPLPEADEQAAVRIGRGFGLAAEAAGNAFTVAEAHKHGTGIKRLSRELLDDPAFDVERYLSALWGRAFHAAIAKLPAQADTMLRVAKPIHVHRLDERFIDFGEVGFVAFGRFAPVNWAGTL